MSLTQNVVNRIITELIIELRIYHIFANSVKMYNSAHPSNTLARPVK